MRILFLFPALTLAACGAKDAGEEFPAGTPTWYQDVAPIASENCVNCHNEGGIASFLDLGEYDQAKAWASLIQAKVESLEMPPFLAADTPECNNEWGFMHDKRLAISDISTIAAWVEAGSPEGDPQTAAETTIPPVVHIARIDQELSPVTAYTTRPSSEIEDELICFVLDPQLASTRFLEGFEPTLDNLDVTHHMVVNTATRAEANAMDAADGKVDGIYDCFGGTGASGPLIGGWVPGTGPTLYPNQSALPVSPEEVFVVQMHYHNVPTAETDRSGMQLQWSDSAPEKLIYVELIGNASDAADGLQPGPNDPGEPAFFIPAGAKRHTEISRHSVPIPEGEEYSIFMVVPHMHYVGVEMRAWIERADGTPGPCLVHTPAWDFDWQLFYYYDAAADNAPITRAGDTLVLECTYDNTTDNEGVQRIMAEHGLNEPQDVVLGDGSLFEMCILAVGAIPR